MADGGRTPGLVSVIVPFHAVDPGFLREAIGSVRAQSYTRWELILVADRAPEECQRIAVEASLEDPGRVVFVSTRPGNSGAAPARNRGLEVATGEFVACLDADDVWLPHKLREQVALLASHPEAGMLYGNILYWYGWTGRAEDRRRDHVPPLGVPGDTVLPPPEALTGFVSGTAAVPCPTSILLRRSVLDSVGGWEDRFQGPWAQYEDQALYAKMTLSTPVYVSSGCWERYRQHPDSVMARSQVDGLGREARRFYLTWLGEYLDDQGVTHAELRRAIRLELWRLDHPVAGWFVRRGRKLLRRVRGA